MWELYAAWFALNAFFNAVFAGGTRSAGSAAAAASVMAFITIAAGAIGAVVAGAFADRVGRANVAIASMLISAACALTIGWTLAFPVYVTIIIAIIWGVSIVADSAQFSAIVTEVAPPHAVGTALTLQTSLGFALTAFSISLTGHLSSTYGWGVAFSILAIGPLLGVVFMRMFQNP
jgi:MFS family permease